MEIGASLMRILRRELFRTCRLVSVPFSLCIWIYVRVIRSFLNMGKEKDGRRDFRCIPYIGSPMSGLSAEDWFRLFSNYMMFGSRCELIDGETGETYYGDRKKIPAMLRRIYRESAEILMRTYTPEFRKIIDQTISEMDVTEYETRKEYLASVYEKAGDVCRALVEKRLEQTEGENCTESIAAGKIKAMVSRTMEELLDSWPCCNQMYEIYQETEKEED